MITLNRNAVLERAVGEAEAAVGALREFAERAKRAKYGEGKAVVDGIEIAFNPAGLVLWSSDWSALFRLASAGHPDLLERWEGEPETPNRSLHVVYRPAAFREGVAKAKRKSGKRRRSYAVPPTRARQAVLDVFQGRPSAGGIIEPLERVLGLPVRDLAYEAAKFLGVRPDEMLETVEEMLASGLLVERDGHVWLRGSFGERERGGIRRKTARGRKYDSAIRRDRYAEIFGRIRELWLQGKSIAQIETDLGIKILFGPDSTVGSLHRDVMGGFFEVA